MAIKNTPKSLRFLLRETGNYQRPNLFWRATSVIVIMSQLLLCDSALAQVSNPSIVAVTVSPSGQACTANLPLKLLVPAGTLWSCQGGTYAQVGGGGGAVSAVSNSDGTLTISPTTGAVVASLALGHANTWTGAQNFGANTTQAQNTSMSSTAAGFSAWTLSAHSDTGNAVLNLTTVNNAAILLMTHSAASTQALSIGNNDSGIQFTDAAAADLNLAAPSGQMLRIGSGFGTASVMQVGVQVSYTPSTIAFSATPAITTAPLQTITLTGNATPTITIANGEHLVMQICQDSTGSRTWTWPASVHGGMTIGSTLSTCSQQAFDSFNGTTLVAENTGVTGVAP